MPEKKMPKIFRDALKEALRDRTELPDEIPLVDPGFSNSPRNKVFPRAEYTLTRNLAKCEEQSKLLIDPKFWLERMRQDALGVIRHSWKSFPDCYSKTDLGRASVLNESAMQAVQALSNLDTLKTFIDAFETPGMMDAELGEFVRGALLLALLAGDSLVSSALLHFERNIEEGRRRTKAGLYKRIRDKEERIYRIDYYNELDAALSHAEKLEQLEEHIEVETVVVGKTLQNQIPKNAEKRRLLREKLALDLAMLSTERKRTFDLE